MTLEHFEVGREPLVKIGVCRGHLEVRGSDRDDVRIEGVSLHETRTTQEGSALILGDLPGDARISLPESGRIEIEQVTGNLDIKDVQGGVSIGEVNGDLIARRCRQIAVTDGVRGSAQIKEITGDVQIGEINGSCTVRQVAEALIEGAVSGSFHAREITGAVQAGDIGGSLSAREIGALAVGNVGGEASVRSTTGAVTIEAVAADLVLRDIGGAAAINHIGGDLIIRHAPMGLQIDQVGGDAALRTAFAPETQSHIREIGGEASIRLEGEGDVRIVLPPNAEVYAPGLAVTREAEQVAVQAGSGAASLSLSARGSVVIKGGGPDEFTVTFDDDFDDQWEHLTARIEEQLENKMRDLPDRIRVKVQRKLEAARRHMGVAQRQAEEALKRVERHLDGLEINVAVGSTASRGEPVREEERLRILQMLEEGKVTVEQAEQLLAALEG